MPDAIKEIEKALEQCGEQLTKLSFEYRKLPYLREATKQLSTALGSLKVHINDLQQLKTENEQLNDENSGETIALVAENKKLREALVKIRNKAGSHTVVGKDLDENDPGFAGIFIVATNAIK